MDRERRLGARIGTAIAVGAYWLLLTLGRPWRLFDPGLLTSQFFDAQAHSLLHGHLSVPPSIVGIEGIVTDHGTQMYFGILPAVLRLPFALVFGHAIDGRVAGISSLIAVALLCWSAARLFRRAETVVRGDAEVARPRLVYALAAMAPAVATPVLFLGAGTWVYHEAIVWGVAASVWGLDAVLGWWLSRRRRDLVIAGLAAAVAISARPSSGLAPMLALLLLAALTAWRRRWREVGGPLVAAGSAMFAYVLVDVGRFHQLWGAPFARQVGVATNPVQVQALADTGGSLLSPSYAVSSLARYLNPWPGLTPPARLFPFVRWGPTAKPVLASSHMYVEPTGSLPLAAPVLLVLAVVGVVWMVRARPGAGWYAVTVAPAMAVLVTVSFWSIIHRYLADFVPLLVVAAAPGGWVLLGRLERSEPTRRRIATGVVLAVSMVACYGQVGLALLERHFAYVPNGVEEAAFLRLQYGIDDTLFSGPPPLVVHQPIAAPAADHGRVLIAGDCASIYERVLGLWLTIDRSSGRGTRALVIGSPSVSAALAQHAVIVGAGSGWHIELQRDGSTARGHFVYVRGAAILSGPSIVLTNPLVFDVVADPVVGLVEVLDGRAAVLYVPNAPASTGVQPAAGWTVQPTSSAFCESLLRRMNP